MRAVGSSMSTRQTSRRGVASAMRAECPLIVSAVLLLNVMLLPTGFLLLARTPLLLQSISLIHSRSQRSWHWPRAACRPTVTVLALPCGTSRVRMRSSGLQPGCSAILNKCCSSVPCQRSQFDNRIDSSEARIVGHGSFRFKTRSQHSFKSS